MTTDKCTSKYGRENCIHHGSRIASPVPPRHESEAKLGVLNARIFSTHSRTALRQLEAERSAVQLDSDASPEGIVELSKRVLANGPADPFRYADDQRLSGAQAHYHNRLTEVAVSDYKAAGNKNYQRLFFDTGVTLDEHDGFLLIVDEQRFHPEQQAFALADPDFDAKITQLRQEVGARRADAARYGIRNLDDDLQRSPYTPVFTDSARNTQHVINPRNPAEVIAQVEYNTNGAFTSATVAHSSGDGSVVKFSSPAQLRMFLAEAKTKRPKALPSYITGIEEPVPAYAAPAAKDVEELDVLF